MCENRKKPFAEYVGVGTQKHFGIPSADLGERSDCALFVFGKRSYSIGESELREFLPPERLDSLQDPQEPRLLQNFLITPLAENGDVQALNLQFRLWRFQSKMKKHGSGLSGNGFIHILTTAV